MPRISRSPEEAIDPTVRTTAFTAEIERVYRLDPTAGDFDVHLPTASGVGSRDILLTVEYSGVNSVTVVPSGIETVAGLPALTLGNYEDVYLTSNGVSNWMKF